MNIVCQQHLPILPWMDPALCRLPGILPLGEGPWLWRDEAFAAQMSRRDDLLALRREQVFATDAAATEACTELLELVVVEIGRDGGYQCSPQSVTRPDGVAVDLHGGHPLAVAGRLVQEDLLILQKPADEHVLVAGVLCFPASWTLTDKIDRGLAAIHGPVAPYDADIARRVQRLLDGIRTEIPIWRANFLLYEDPELFQPRREDDRRSDAHDRGNWVRVERQTLRRLAGTKAIVFTVHTFVVPLASLKATERDALLLALHKANNT